mmetsp:Transcript_251/g.633  ORF Transcript_251/g.633 Transcript_251/m.633 type:complete len:210 (-) Transcript_251:322-951(-)
MRSIAALGAPRAAAGKLSSLARERRQRSWRQAERRDGCCERVDLRNAVAGRQTDAQPACPLRHRRRADRRHVHAVARQQRRRRADRCSLAAQHDRHHRAQRRKRQRQAQAARQRPHVRASPRLARCHTQRGQSRRDRGQWQRSGVHVGAAFVDQEGLHVSRAAHKAAVRPERLAQRADAHVDCRTHARRGCRAGARVTAHACRVRLIKH